MELDDDIFTGGLGAAGDDLAFPSFEGVGKGLKKVKKGKHAAEAAVESTLPGLEAPADSSTAAAAAAASTKKKKGGGFQTLGLSAPVLGAILKMGYKVPTPIQRQTLPLALSGRDVVAMARTGSGKTAAFLIPLLEKLKKHSTRIGCRAIILAPTREIAQQSLKFCKQMSRYTDIKAIALLGGESMEEQFAALADNPDIIVATPGRLMHLLLEVPGFNLKQCEYVVFDEADRLFELGLAEQLQEIVNRLPESRQTLLFSATLPKALVSFAKAGLKDPELVRLDVETKVSENLRLAFFTVRKEEKAAALVWTLKTVIPEQQQVMVFVATKHHTEFIVPLLQMNGINAEGIYGAMDQTARTSNLTRFRTAKIRVLVVTDVAARGIDIPLLDNVINYDFPDKAKLFVHRVGRVARQGRVGTAFSLVQSSDIPYMLDFYNFLGREPTNLFTGQRASGEEEDGANANPFKTGTGTSGAGAGDRLAAAGHADSEDEDEEEEEEEDGMELEGKTAGAAAGKKGTAASVEIPEGLSRRERRKFEEKQKRAALKEAGVLTKKVSSSGKKDARRRGADADERRATGFSSGGLDLSKLPAAVRDLLPSTMTSSSSAAAAGGAGSSHTAPRGYTLDSMHPTDVHYGQIPRSAIHNDLEIVREQMQKKTELQAVQKSVDNALQLYNKTRAEASKRNAAAAKALADDRVHPLLLQYCSTGEEHMRSYISGLQSFRPSQTIMELDASKQAKAAATATLQAKRKFHAHVVAPRVGNVSLVSAAEAAARGAVDLSGFGETLRHSLARAAEEGTADAALADIAALAEEKKRLKLAEKEARTAAAAKASADAEGEGEDDDDDDDDDEDADGGAMEDAEIFQDSEEEDGSDDDEEDEEDDDESEEELPEPVKPAKKAAAAISSSSSAGKKASAKGKKQQQDEEEEDSSMEQESSAASAAPAVVPIELIVAANRAGKHEKKSRKAAAAAAAAAAEDDSDAELRCFETAFADAIEEIEGERKSTKLQRKAKAGAAKKGGAAAAADDDDDDEDDDSSASEEGASGAEDEDEDDDTNVLMARMHEQLEKRRRLLEGGAAATRGNGGKNGKKGTASADSGNAVLPSASFLLGSSTVARRLGGTSAAAGGQDDDDGDDDGDLIFDAEERDRLSRVLGRPATALEVSALPSADKKRLSAAERKRLAKKGISVSSAAAAAAKRADAAATAGVTISSLSSAAAGAAGAGVSDIALLPKSERRKLLREGGLQAEGAFRDAAHFVTFAKAGDVVAEAAYSSAGTLAAAEAGGRSKGSGGDTVAADMEGITRMEDSAFDLMSDDKDGMSKARKVRYWDAKKKRYLLVDASEVRHGKRRMPTIRNEAGVLVDKKAGGGKDGKHAYGELYRKWVKSSRKQIEAGGEEEGAAAGGGEEDDGGDFSGRGSGRGGNSGNMSGHKRGRQEAFGSSSSSGSGRGSGFRSDYASAGTVSFGKGDADEDRGAGGGRGGAGGGGGRSGFQKKEGKGGFSGGRGDSAAAGGGAGGKHKGSDGSQGKHIQDQLRGAGQIKKERMRKAKGQGQLGKFFEEKKKRASEGGGGKRGGPGSSKFGPGKKGSAPSRSKVLGRGGKFGGGGGGKKFGGGGGKKFGGGRR